MTALPSRSTSVRALIEQLWNSGNGVLSTQVLQELCINLRRRVNPPLPVEKTRRLIQDYLSWEVIVNAPDATLQALDLEQGHQISFWDSLILQAAEMAGATVLYSEDFSADQNYGSIRVVNPLIT